MAKMTLPKYFIGMDTLGELAPCVIQRDYPNAVGYVFLVGKDDTEGIEKYNLEAANGRMARCYGYSVYIAIGTTLSGDRVEDDKQETILREMADYFTEARLKYKPGVYRCYTDNPKEIPPKEVRDMYQAKRQAYLRHRKERENR